MGRVCGLSTLKAPPHAFDGPKKVDGRRSSGSEGGTDLLTLSSGSRSGHVRGSLAVCLPHTQCDSKTRRNADGGCAPDDHVFNRLCYLPVVTKMQINLF